MKCLGCGGKMTTTREDHPYRESGLPNVVLRLVEVNRCAVCGETSVSIPRVEELHRTLAFAVASRRARLDGHEVRFLRKYLGYSATDFAATIGVDKSTVSRWENQKEPIGPTADRLLRLMVLRQRPIEEYPTEHLAGVAQDDAARRNIVAREAGKRWTAAEETDQAA